MRARGEFLALSAAWRGSGHPIDTVLAAFTAMRNTKLRSNSDPDSTPDLFGPRPRLRKAVRPPSLRSAELVRARALCRQLEHAQAPDAKRRMAHLICLNLKAMLSRPV